MPRAARRHGDVDLKAAGEEKDRGRFFAGATLCGCGTGDQRLDSGSVLLVASFLESLPEKKKSATHPGRQRRLLLCVALALPV